MGGKSDINSSVYVVSRISNSKFFLTRLFWFIILITCLICFTYRIQEFYHLYHQYPVVVSLRLDHKYNLHFPAITICNLNRRKTVKIPEGPGGSPIEINLPIGTPLLLSERSSLISCKKRENGTSDRERGNFKKLEFLETHYTMDKKEISKHGHNIPDMLKECSMNGKSCSALHLNQFVSFRFGNCFTFNKKRQEMESEQISEVGAGSGLNLRLNLEIDKYASITHTMGAVITIHNPEEIPNPEENGFIVSPGYEISISLKQTVVRRFPAPYKDRCLNYKRKANEYANKNECIRSCIQGHNFAKCSCIDPTLVVRKNEKLCNLMNVTEICCLDEVLKYLTYNGPVCDCPLPCNSVHYNEKVSKALLPRTHPGKTSSMKLNVFYSSLERQVYEYRPKFDFPEFLSYLGNILGLWLGLSLVAVFELFENVLLCAKYIVKARISCLK
ncbi:acid-sensing ion channel 1 [Nephila pilipes]|uniref:Acid-sensing ion channel 1 n=1 Tax=Nephila pilipes TaxID=299642 RepID=A0A8X6TRL1_NEPPI|nr:acid-sensing ion channel 1 [Nephila pilipes]